LKINYFSSIKEIKPEKNIILIVNPVAGGIDKSEIIEAAFFADKEGLNLALYTTTGIDDIAKIKVLYDTLNRKESL
jgi:hypothetical protein